ncbi:MAG: GAF domain-containing protein [Anaerolineae bacterium]|jgi:GAF domain-containing protein|nr:GAF domain-containing protein [Anaerolineae bacterium]
MHTKPEENLAERRATLLQAGAKVARSVISILDPEQLLETTVDLICDTFGFYYAGVFLIDETGTWAELHAARGAAGKALLAEGHKLKVDGHSMVGRATGNRCALIALDVGEEPVHFKNPHLPDTRSEMALPLIVGDTLIGALTVQSTEEAAFNDDDITAIQAMADQLAIAIHNARLHRENQRLLTRFERRARLLGAAAQVGRQVTSILDLDVLLNNTVDIICEAYGFYYAGIFLLEPTGEWAVLRAGHGEAGQKMLAEGHQLRIGGHSMIGTAISQRKARIALDVGEEPVHFKNPYLPHTRSEMALPLIVGDTVIGALTVQSIEERAFSNYDITSLQAMADQLAVALRNAQLLRELEAAHAEIVRTKTYEAIAAATLEAIHWIGNKALPITASVERLRDDMMDLSDADPLCIESMREDLEIIEQSARLIVDVKENLIGPAREQKPRPAMVEDVVKDAVTLLALPPEWVHYEIATGDLLCLADTTQLGRALAYVLKNATEALEGRAEPQILIAVAPAEGDTVAISIADNGPGIPPEALDKIWATFYTTKGASHAGLGLSATLQILNQLEGTIYVRNLPEGGACFEMRLPVPPAAPTAVALPGGKHILLIDDEDAWSIFATQVLTDAGNTVTRTACPESAPGDYDIIVLDNALTAADSLECLRKLRKAGYADKVLVVASRLWAERATQMLQMGVKDIVLKPYTPAEMGILFA